MDDLDKRIITVLQAGLPVEERPFDALAARLGVGADVLLDRVRGLLESGAVRRLGPIFDSRGLGYVSTLVAARVPPARLEEVAARVTRLPGVTHNYERVHAYNLWFTLTSPTREMERETLARLRTETGIPDFFSLPALEVYKIRVQFNLTDEPPPASDEDEAAPPAPGTAAPATLLDAEKRLVRLLQDGLPVEREPLARAAGTLGWTPAQVADKLRQWLAMGVIRRYGAVVRHHRLGYAANGMAVFRVDPTLVSEAGRCLARRTEVSHCYQRPPLPDFPYNLFAMTHGKTEDEVRTTVAAMAGEAGLDNWSVLFSVREFKKVSMRYFVEGEAP